MNCNSYPWKDFESITEEGYLLNKYNKIRSFYSDLEHYLKSLSNYYWMWECIHCNFKSFSLSNLGNTYCHHLLESENKNNKIRLNEAKFKRYKNQKSMTKSPSLLLKRCNLHLKTEDLLRYLNFIEFDYQILIFGKEKAQPKEGPLSSKRSRFIGVFKNGEVWQALININNRKTYIGTYDTEGEAARAFDFYSILIHFFDAKTNFDYTKENIINMIMNFKLNDNTFIPQQLFFN